MANRRRRSRDERTRWRIREEVADPEGQLELFSPDERQQLERDVESLKARLEQIPEEIDQTERIRSRYVDADPQLFQFALVFVVPRSIMEVTTDGLDGFTAGGCPDGGVWALSVPC